MNDVVHLESKNDISIVTDTFSINCYDLVTSFRILLDMSVVLNV